MRPLVFDFETLGLASSVENYPENDRQPPGNLKDPVKIAAWREKDRTRYLGECSTNPRLGRVLCMSTQHGLWYAQSEAHEAGLLATFWEQACDHGGQIATWNGKHFDVPFAVIRSLAHGITPLVPAATIRTWLRRYSFDLHFDVKAALLNWDMLAKGEGLAQWSRFFGVPLQHEEFDGSDVAFLYANDQHEEIQAHCVDDRTATERLYDLVAPYFGGAA